MDSLLCKFYNYFYFYLFCKLGMDIIIEIRVIVTPVLDSIDLLLSCLPKIEKVNECSQNRPKLTLINRYKIRTWLLYFFFSYGPLISERRQLKDQRVTFQVPCKNGTMPNIRLQECVIYLHPILFLLLLLPPQILTQ